MKISESIENYLECIFMLSKQQEAVHSIDIANELGVTKPSVSHATKLLRENNYITMDADNHISLTDTGRQIAERMYERHHLLSDLLMSLGVSEKTALEDACKIEHDISEESFDAICRYATEKGANHLKASDRFARKDF